MKRIRKFKRVHRAKAGGSFANGRTHLEHSNVAIIEKGAVSHLQSNVAVLERHNQAFGAREIAGMYLANKVQNIKGSADTLLDLAGLTQDEIRPVAEAMEQGGRLAAKAQVTDEILDKCKPIAGTAARDAQ